MLLTSMSAPSSSTGEGVCYHSDAALSLGKLGFNDGDGGILPRPRHRSVYSRSGCAVSVVCSRTQHAWGACGDILARLPERGGADCCPPAAGVPVRRDLQLGTIWLKWAATAAALRLRRRMHRLNRSSVPAPDGS